MKSCSVQVMSTTLSFVDEKHIRNVTVNNTCDSEVKLSKSKGDDGNAIDYSTDSESEQSHSDIPLSALNRK